ncbi:MAG: hypothetical protein R3D29_09785 [Nitratireductor sp.]
MATCGVWWAETRPWRDRAWLHAVFSDCAEATWAPSWTLSADLFPALDRKETRMPVVPPGARRSTMNINT